MEKNHSTTSLNNLKAIVTGGSSGIGKEISLQLSANDVEAAIVDIEEPPAEFSGDFFPFDLRNTKGIAELSDKIVEQFGQPDILILNAGKGIHEKLTKGDPKLWEEIFHINVFANLWLIRALVPGMQKKGKGDVIIISSVSAKQAFPYGGIYGATKAALDLLAETLRLEVQPDVRVTTIHPGVVDTPFFKNMIHGTQTPKSIGWGAVTAEQIAESVIYALKQNPEIALNDLVIRPAAQPL